MEPGSGRPPGSLSCAQYFKEQPWCHSAPRGHMRRLAHFTPPGTGTMHLILAVTDHGAPRLTRYQGVRVHVVAKP